MFSSLRKLLTLTLLTAATGMFHSASAQQALSDTWAASGSANNITTGEGKVFIYSYGEWFGESYVSDHFVLNSDLSHDDSWPKGDGYSYAVVGDGNGGYYAAQYDTIMHYKADKTSEGLPIKAYGITQLARIGNILYVAGYFSDINGTARTSMAAVDIANGYALTPFAPEPNSTVNVLYVQNGMLYVGGYFSAIGGQTRSKLAAIDPATGLATSWNPQLSTEFGSVNSIQGNANAIYFCGSFSNVNNADPVRANFAAVAVSDASVLPFNPQPDGYMQALALDNSVLYAAGNFQNIGGGAKKSVAALDATTGAVLPFNIDFAGNNTPYLYTMAVDGDNLLIAGDLYEVNGKNVGSLVAVNKTTGASASTKPRNVDGTINSIVVDNGKIFLAGSVDGITGINNPNGFFGLDKNGHGFEWNAEIPEQPEDTFIQGTLLNYYNGKVYFYQRFSNGSTNIGALSPTTGELISTFSVTVNGNIDAWTFGNDAIYLAGDFDQINKDNRYGMGAISAETGQTLPWEVVLQPNSDQEVNSMTFYDNTVFVGGRFYFSNQNGDFRYDLMAFNATTGDFTDWNPQLPDVDFNAVRVGSAENNQIYIIGDFFFRVDTKKGEADIKWEPDFSGSIYEMAIGPNVVYAGGNFNPGVLAFEKQTGKLADLQPDVGDVTDDEGGLEALTVGNGKLYVGGEFTFSTAVDQREDYAEFLLDISGNRPPVIETTKISVTPGQTIKVPLPRLLSDPDGNLDLTTLKVLEQPISGAKASIDTTYNLVLDYTGITFSGTESLVIEVCDLLSACTQQLIQLETGADIIVYNGVSPNEDQMNEVLLIENIDVYPKNKNKVSIIDRWGDVVFEVFDYNNDDRSFRGISKSGSELPAGTYYYKIEFTDGSKARVGHLALRR